MLEHQPLWATHNFAWSSTMDYDDEIDPALQPAADSAQPAPAGTPATLPVTHTVEVFSNRRVPSLNYPATFPADYALPGKKYRASLQDDHYVLVDLTAIRINPMTEKKVEVEYGWLKNDLELWGNLHTGDDRRVSLLEVKAAAA